MYSDPDNSGSDCCGVVVDARPTTSRLTDFTVRSILARPATAGTVRHESAVRNRSPMSGAQPETAAVAALMNVRRQQSTVRCSAAVAVTSPSASSVHNASAGSAVYGSTLIERYIYSLPEYRVRCHQRNFIEICSFNGLLATRKVIGRNEAHTLALYTISILN